LAAGRRGSADETGVFDMPVLFDSVSLGREKPAAPQFGMFIALKPEPLV
jgi:hypothetical protein